MATHTTYYNLTKPSQNDKVNIGALNDNADKIDTALHNKVDSDDLTANNVMLSDGVTSVEDALDAHTFGTAVDITSYTSSSKYTCPSDGYVTIHIGSDNSGTLIVDEPSAFLSIGGYQGRYSLFVKKGMKLYIDASPVRAYFYPLS